MSVLKQFKDGAYKIYVPTEKSGATDIKYEFYYNIGGMNYFTGSGERRGWYFSALPVTRSGNFEQFGAFTGGKVFVSPDEVTRNSKKAEREARENITEDVINNLLARIGV